jgi:hypothetical protein
MTPEWMRYRYKADDIFFTLPVGVSLWGKANHEPLFGGLCFPFIRLNPWKL